MKRKSQSIRNGAAIAATAAMFLAAPAFAAFGDVDTTFGGAIPGFAINDLGGDADIGLDVVTGREDRLYALGLRCNEATCAADNTLVVSGFDADGDLLSGFGTNGDLAVVQDVNLERNYKLEVDDGNQRIYVGYTICGVSCRLVIERHKFADGTLDATYGDGGIAEQQIGALNVSLTQLMLQPNGKLLALIERDIVNASDEVTGRDVGVARFGIDGEPDESWGTQGLAQAGTANGCDRFPSMTIGRTPTIYVTAAQANTCAGPYQPVVTRLTAAGQRDAGFGTGGRVTGNFGQTGDFVGFVAQEQLDGKIAYAMGRGSGSGVAIDIVRLNSDGSQDTSFAAEHGIYEPMAPFTPVGNNVFQSDGKAVFNGRYASQAGDDQALNRVMGSSLLAHPVRFTAGVPFVGFSLVSGEISEAAGSVTVSVVTSAPAPDTITVPFSLAGSASRPLDYQVSATAFVIPAGASTGSITLTLVNDDEEEFDDTILFTLGNAAPNGQTASNADTLIVTIVDNDFVVVPPPPGDTGGGALPAGLLLLLGLAGLHARHRRRH